MTLEFHFYLMADGILNIIDGLVKLLSLGFYQTNLSIRWILWYYERHKFKYSELTNDR